MVTRREREETIRHWGETPSPGSVLRRCAAGLAIVIGLAMSAVIGDEHPAGGMQAAAGNTSAAQLGAARAAPRHGLADAAAEFKAAPAQPDPRSVSD